MELAQLVDLMLRLAPALTVAAVAAIVQLWINRNKK